MKRRLLKNKRGFTLVETVVALALILIVSATSLTLISSANNATQRALFNAKAQNFVSDVVTIYRTETSVDGFKNSVKNILEKELDENLACALDGGYTADIDIDGAKLTVTVKNENEKQVAEATYIKGEALNNETQTP